MRPPIIIMECLIRISTLTSQKVSGILLKVDSDDTNKVQISFRIDLGVYDDLLRSLKTSHALLEVNNGIVVKAEPVSEEVNPHFAVLVDPLLIMKSIIGKEISKKEFYEKYTKISKCSKRTAITHLKRAIDDGKINEIDYYTIGV